MEALYIHPSEEAGVMIEEEEEEKSGEQDEGGTEASSPTGSTTDEEADGDSEPEPPSVVRRKVSFADAFGLDLVSVKEFDNAEVTDSEISWSDERPAVQLLEEFYLSCLFTSPSSPEELDQRLQTQMVELESIELLPGTTTIRGIIRVVNLCYSKSVYARISMDQWRSYFDLLAEYVPGSSDRKTDRFTFRYTLIPPFEKEGTRVEFCLRYETSVGTFWANNRDMNYVLFCHQKGQVIEHVHQTQEENNSYKSKRSCLRANRNGTTEEKTKETINTNTVSAEAAHKVERAGRETMDNTETQSQLRCEEHKPWVESVKSRRRATRLAHVQDYFSQKRQQLPKAYSHDSHCSQKVSQHTPAPWGDSASFLYKCQKMQLSKSPPVLTYHQIPLLPLDWKNDTPQQWGTADVEDILTGRDKRTLSKASKENTPSVNDMWESFSKSTDGANNKESSVSDVWQVFLNGPSCKDHSNVPESEWLQTAASVSPSNDKPPQIQYAARSQDFVELQVGTDTPTTSHSHTLAACQLLSDACETSSATGALNTEDHQPAEACVTGPRDDSPAAQDAFQRSQTNSVTDTPQEFSLKRAPPVSKDSVDSPTECHKHAVWERESEGIIGRAERIGGDEPFILHTADLVTSSGESETTDMTAMPESQNASAVDRISQGARQDEGLSSTGEGEVICTTHNAIDDMLAFRETIRQEAKDGEMCVFSNSRQEVEEGITMNYMEKKASTGEAIYRPQTEECKISPRYADESQSEKFRLTQNSENPFQLSESGGGEIRLALSHAGGFDPNQTCGKSFEQNRAVATEGIDSVPSNNPNTGVSRKTTSGGTEGQSVGIKVLAEQAWRHNNDTLQLNSSGQMGSPSFILEACDKQSRPIPVGEELCNQKGEDLVVTQTEQSSELKHEKDKQVLNQTGKGQTLSCDEKAMERREINPSAHTRLTVYPMEVRPCSTDKYNPNLLEMVEQRQTHSQQDLRGQKEDVSSEISLEKEMAKENFTKRDASTEHQPEKSERIEGDMSQEDERVSIGKLKIEAMRESMGNVETPHGEKANAMKKGELSAEVESFLCVEYKKLSEGAKDPIRAENTVSLEAIEPRLEPMFIERFGEDLVRRIWEEVFVREVQPSERHTNTVDEMRKKLADTAQDCHLILKKDLSDTLDSGVFFLTESETDSNLSLCQGPEQTFVAESNECSPKDRCQSLASTKQTHILSELQFDLDSSAHLRQNIITTSAAHSGQSLSESGQALRFPMDQENCCQIEERSITHKETSGQMEDHVAAHKESVHQSVHLSHKHLSSSSERAKESDALLWWTILYSITHFTRLITCTFLVCGFFVTVFFYDFPTFFALYIFSLCLWIFKWKRDHVRTDKGMVG